MSDGAHANLESACLNTIAKSDGAQEQGEPEDSWNLAHIPDALPPPPDLTATPTASEADLVRTDSEPMSERPTEVTGGEGLQALESSDILAPSDPSTASIALDTEISPTLQINEIAHQPEARPRRDTQLSTTTREPLAHDEHVEQEPVQAATQLATSHEHQGDATEMEEAVDEKPNAPLLEDPEAPPTVEEMDHETLPAISSAQEHSLLEDHDDATLAETAPPVPQAMLDRSFPTNFTNILTPAEGKNELGEEADRLFSSSWPAVGDGKSFGELLDDGDSTGPKASALIDEKTNNVASDPWGTVEDDDTFGELLGKKESKEELRMATATTVVEGDKTEEDLAAMFAAALDDDDLLEDPKDLDPSQIFGDDDPGFLDDDLLKDPPAQLLSSPLSTVGSVPNQSPANSYFPAAPGNSTQRAAQPSSHNPSFGGAHGRSAGTPLTGLYDVYNQGSIYQQQQQQQPPPPKRPNPQSSQSFVDKSKGGYQSPYDLPMEVVKPRQRPRQALPHSQAVSTPPPRSSSMVSHQVQPPAQQSAIGSGNTSLIPPSPPSSSGSMPGPSDVTANTAASAKALSQASNGFFADLPVAPKPRARTSGTYTPQYQSVNTPPVTGQTHPSHISRVLTASPGQHTQRPQGPPTPAQQPVYAGLSQPERLPLLPDQPTSLAAVQNSSFSAHNQRYLPGGLPAPTQTHNRFSPAPPSQGPPGAAPRYSPAPNAQAAPKKYGSAQVAAPNHSSIQQAHQFAPRTSSPLAFHDKPLPTQPIEVPRGRSSQPPSPPKSSAGLGSPAFTSPHRAGSLSYSPNEQRTPSLASIASPPRRPRTRSPSTASKAKYSTQASTELPTLSTSSTSVSAPRKALLPHRRKFSKDLIFTPPTDEHDQDPLQRWQGCPVFRWDDFGTVVSSFPKQTPFYAAGHGSPSVKCTPGPITVEQAVTFMPMDELDAKFPGPLPTKAKKKKDVLAWMTSKIEALERQAEAARMNFNMEPHLKKREDEKVVLWKVVKIFVENDGKLQGDKRIDEEIRAVLLPNLTQLGQVNELQSPIGISGAGAALQPDPIDKPVVVQLRQALLEGHRERAVWLAEEKKLWGHAMLIASTMGAETWRQIIQSFVRSQVKTVGSDARSLAALYQVFAGNAEECVDELVPPSARAGFQMVSKTAGAVATNPLEGLDQWQETLGLIAGNRTPTDGHSLLSLGKLLSHYGRAEAAHTCFLFARPFAKHTGADDPEAAFVLLGVNHQKPDESYGGNLDAIMLTEIYEWVSSIAVQKAEYVPHLQSYKLIHAQELAGHGLKNQAQAYCDHITTAYQSTTKPSQYYHPTFTQSVADLSALLSQTPQSGPQGLLSKGAMNKVSSKTASWFTRFVSGDDDQQSNASGTANEDVAGPFGKVNGDSLDTRHVGSGPEIYNPMVGGGITSYGTSSVSSSPQQFFHGAGAAARYAPPAVAGNKYAPTAAGGLSATETRPSTSSSRSYASAPSPQSMGVPRPEVNRAASDYTMPYMSDSRPGSSQHSTGSHESRPFLTEQHSLYSSLPMIPQEHQIVPQEQQSRIAEVNSAGEQSISDPEDAGGGGGYEPPTIGYEPPSYQPYQPEPEEDEDKPKPKKKSFMDDDDDDDIAIRAAAIKSSPTPLSKAEADRIAEENFKKAAEADAARASSSKGGGDKKGWFGGWFAGKKEAGGMPQQNGPIKAKLGEENSFYYDKDLGKWVNKKDPKGAETAAAATPPPPPRMGPSRSASGVMGPPSGPPSRVASGAAPAGMAMPPGAPRSMSGSVAGPPSLPGSNPPSRIGTPAGTFDGPPMPASVAAISGIGYGPPSQPPSRPATSMSNASSLDDLLGGPPGPGRKAGGSVKSKKKGGRYVDVMQAK